MWVYLATWLVEDGEIPELRVGQTLQHVSLRASCWSTEPTNSAPGVSELTGPDPDGEPTPHYQVTGTVLWRGERSSSLLLDVGEFQILAEPNDARKIPSGVGSGFALELFSPDFHLHDVGRRVSVICNLEVVPAHEWDDYPFDNPSRDWQVAQIRVQERGPWQGTLPGRANRGPIVRVDDIDDMRQWTVNPHLPYSSYLLDLRTAAPTA